MMECLLAYSYLWAWEFCPMEEYTNRLDSLFSETPEDEVLLDLEECCTNYKDTFARLHHYFEYEAPSFDTTAFASHLAKGLETAFISGKYTLHVFTKRCYQLWTCLPHSICMREPFDILSYVDDPLSWGDEEQSRALLKLVFNFYKESQD